MFIVIEGLDGVGKTTAAKMLARRVGGEFFPWLHAPYDQSMPYIWDVDEISEASKHMAFLAAFKHMSDLVGTPPFLGKTIVTDRYYYCSLAMHGPLAFLNNALPLKLDYAAFCFEKPDFAFYLTIDEDLRRQRLAERDKPLSPAERLLEANPDFCLAVRKNYENLAAEGLMKAIAIDGLSREAVVEVIWREITGKGVLATP